MQIPVTLPSWTIKLTPSDTLQAGDIVMSCIEGCEHEVSQIIKGALIGYPVSFLSGDPTVYRT